MSVADFSSLVSEHGDSKLVHGDFLRLVLFRSVADHVGTDSLLSSLGKILLNHEVVEVGGQT